MPLTATRNDAGLAGALHGTVIRLGRRMRAERADTSLTVSQISVLSTLDAHDALTLGELASRERVQPPTMTRMAGKLVERGLVERSPDPTDGRQVLLRLSDRGAAFLAEDRRRRDEWLASRLRTLTADEKDTLRRALSLLERIIVS